MTERLPASARTIRPWRHGDDHVCEAILRTIPDWFGIEESLVNYARETATLPTWLVEVDDQPLGFVSVKQHFPESAEISVIAMAAGRHRHGLGTLLVEQAERFAREQGCAMLFVKTLGPSRPDANYARTLQFYLARGFGRLEEFHQEWGRIPCLVLCKSLRPGAGNLTRPAIPGT
jgi:GNAT superfamily N-acetyltransferase